MPQLKVMGFDGVVPRMSATMLGDTQAQTADNVKLYSRELRYWRGASLVYTPANSDLKTIYKYYTDSDYRWLTWDTDVDVCLSPSTDTADFRYYYTGDGAPKKSNWDLTTTGSGAYPQSWLNMGVPAPVAAPAVTRVGSGTASPESRVYVYTYVSTFGSVKEESAPSPASALITIYSGDSCTVDTFTAPPSTNYNITHIRIYRSITGETTDSYEFVSEITVATSSYSDTLTASQLGEALATIGWVPPPATLAGLLPLPGGSMVGFVGNTVYFSEPFFPHAWPLAYALNVPYQIVGLGVYGMSVTVMTDRYPYIISGNGPGSMSVERVPILEPCVSKQSIASDEYGTVYASPNGLVGIGPETRGLVTKNLFRRDEWQALSPDQLAGQVVDGKYIGIYPDITSDRKALVLSRDDIPALSYLSVAAVATHVDGKAGSLHYVDATDSKIYQADADELNPVSYKWKSKRFVLPQATSFSVLKVDGQFDQSIAADAYNAQVAAISAANALLFSTSLKGGLNDTAVNTYALNGSILADLPAPAASRSVTVTISGEGVVLQTVQVSTWLPVRLKPFKVRDIAVQIEGNINVRSIALATTQAELRE